MALQKDLELLERTLKSSSLQSRRYERNFENAVRRCLNHSQARRSVLDCWAQALDVSIETFVLLASTFGYNSLTCRTSSLPQLLSRLKEADLQERIRCHPVLIKRADRLHKQGKIFSAILKDC